MLENDRELLDGLDRVTERLPLERGELIRGELNEELLLAPDTDWNCLSARRAIEVCPLP